MKATIQVIEADFIKTENASFEIKNLNKNLIFTSQNAVLSILQHPKIDELKQKNVFCVGLKTKELLNENGLTVEAYTGYAEDLAEIITLVYSDESFTFFSGNLRKDTLPGMLTENEKQKLIKDLAYIFVAAGGIVTLAFIIYFIFDLIKKWY